MTKLNKALVEIVAMPEIQKKMIEGGSDPSSSTPEEFQRIISRDVAKYTKLVKDFSLKAD